LKLIGAGYVNPKVPTADAIRRAISTHAVVSAPPKGRRRRHLRSLQSGEAIETGIVGADGIVGGDAAINGHAFGQSTVQLSGAALTMPKDKFIDAYRAHPRLRNPVDRYQAILLMQAQQNAACHALHSVRNAKEEY
jgi:hypothetical protein